MQRLIGQPTERLGEFDGIEYWKDTYGRLWLYKPETNEGKHVDPSETIEELTAAGERLRAQDPDSAEVPALADLLGQLGSTDEADEAIPA